ncbi:bifunctional UDP-N-acetylglucosamine diphosphorylase/glucosamine-1-phosphate N-acetyltransferase GlmU [Nakamurella sp. PAMC28650]|uniref:bifunctional UDP-N-acetylglucosamine diphosphorylase/glucosamine-1-phosphate N-acetyltransferase GlmU n=1 Tax=Nakamurella sp. PAMC28650 TaxID=2762325 RepID=UPI00164D1826|nr:bifunctional UDP-N-acetylglucosamine diphosphorylase/glucosamine-1-phosphate N-acetyltransferase GlmU [Nakamurella sp. PAMC28650]QNK80985.1 bifunctional UDP-N-acetylglucosamine diphosphorylase/glucosamine-1-phosphate N-acetyltransferase GlmU [Nakamurella sp. PAMC28650]
MTSGEHGAVPGPAVSAVIVLAAGAGTRMRSSIPKVLHPIAGRPLLWHALTSAAALRPERLVAVIGHGRAEVGPYLTKEHPDVHQVIQDQQLGTGHAVACGLEDTGEIAGTVLVTYGDVPLLTGRTLGLLAENHQRTGNAVTVLTAIVENPTGYGRIVRDAAGTISAIVEQKDATGDQRAIREINSGVYAFDGVVLADALRRLTSANAQGERYLTDVVAMARADGHRVGTVLAPDPVETEGVNDRVQLSEMSRALNARLVRRAQLDGVTVIDPATTWIHADVTIGQDTVLWPGTSLESGTEVGGNCVIGPDTTLSDCRVADGAMVLRSHCIGARIGVGASVGPFSFLRAGVVLGDLAKAGAFVEIKNSIVGPRAKVPHLSYVGDAEIGAGTNLGAGTITANYDGVQKSRTIIGENSFIGTDSTLVAPVTIGDGVYVAAGSTVTEDVEAGDLAIARGRQHTSKGWVLRQRAGTGSDRSARAAGALEISRGTAPQLPDTAGASENS